jgi:hypothetical protein
MLLFRLGSEGREEVDRRPRRSSGSASTGSCGEGAAASSLLFVLLRCAGGGLEVTSFRPNFCDPDSMSARICFCSLAVALAGGQWVGRRRYGWW